MSSVLRPRPARTLRSVLLHVMRLVALIAWIAVWLVVAVKVVRRSDLGFGGKAFWLVFILVLFVGYVYVWKRGAFQWD